MISQRRRKQIVLGSFLLCWRPSRSWGKATVLLKGTYHSASQYVLLQPFPSGERRAQSLPQLWPPADASGLEKKSCKSELKGRDGATQARPGFKRRQEMNASVGTHGKGDLKRLRSESSGTLSSRAVPGSQTDCHYWGIKLRILGYTFQPMAMIFRLASASDYLLPASHLLMQTIEY